MDLIGLQEAFAGFGSSGFGIQVIPPPIVEDLQDNDPGDLKSGEIPFTLFHGVPVGSHVDPSLTITVTGRPFRGTLNHLAGAKVTESPVQYTASGSPGSVSGRRAYIVDFGANLTVLSLNMIDPGLTGKISPVKPISLRWRSARPPIRVTSPDAPIMATERGRRRTSRLPVMVGPIMEDSAD